MSEWIDVSRIPVELRSRYAARMAKDVSGLVGRATMVLALVSDLEEFNSGRQIGGIVGLVVEVGETPVGISGGIAGATAFGYIGGSLCGPLCAIVLGGFGGIAGSLGAETLYNELYEQPWE